MMPVKESPAEHENSQLLFFLLVKLNGPVQAFSYNGKLTQSITIPDIG